MHICCSVLMAAVQTSSLIPRQLLQRDPIGFLGKGGATPWLQQPSCRLEWVQSAAQRTCRHDGNHSHTPLMAQVLALALALPMEALLSLHPDQPKVPQLREALADPRVHFSRFTRYVILASSRSGDHALIFHSVRQPSLLKATIQIDCAH